MIREALVIGINKYICNDKLGELKTPAADAEAIANILKKYGNFTVRYLPEKQENGRACNGIEPDPVKNAVSKAQLEEAIRQLFNPKSEQISDTALLFFAGHGLREDRCGIHYSYLASTESRLHEHLWGVELQWLRKLLQQSRVKEQIIWLDCCHSGAILTKEDLEQAYPDDLGKGYSQCFITAARAHEAAFEKTNGKHGVLTEVLLKGLDPSRLFNGQINNEELCLFIEKELKNSKQIPICHNTGPRIILTSRQMSQLSQDQFERWRQDFLQPPLQKWQENHQNDDWLLQGGQLAEAKKYLNKYPNKLNSDEKEYIKKSIRRNRRINNSISTAFVFILLIISIIFIGRDSFIINQQKQMTSFLHEGSTLSENKKYPNALSAYQKSLELARQIGDSFTEGQSLSQIGTIETNFLNQHEDAREHLEQALAIWKKINYIEGQQLVLQKLTQVYANIGKNERSDETKKQVSTLQSELMETQAETKTSQKHKLAGSINNYTCNASVFDVQRDNKKISINYNHPIYIGDQIIVKEEGCSITLNLASQKRTLNHNNSGFVVSPNLNVNVEKKKAIFEVVKKWWNGLRRDSDDVDQTIFVAR